MGHLSTSLLRREINWIESYQVTELVSVMTKREVQAAGRKLNQSQLDYSLLLSRLFQSPPLMKCSKWGWRRKVQGSGSGWFPSYVVRYFRIQSPKLIWILNQSYSLAVTPLGTHFYWLWLCLILYNYRHSGRIKHVQMQANSSFS